ncbi:Smr/MutS family protein [Aliiroseovarius sp. F47248L]|uniref:Smr/MutS family protein n=1 Tax=Aliiroseovarius sp. F47248L TaxID=2926420 RepID=UPI001FF36A48|nr:Smr/MutS family protein [Aliiroseovarius sp. F47248L]MCK0140180.1 Smr/MutS family protein [Aliiroseovarius sp. F47248L]
MARRPRHLSAEDKALWKKVADSTERMHAARPLVELPAANSPLTKKPQPKACHPAFQVGQNTKPNALPHDLAPSLSNSVASQPVSMDRKTFGKMKKGRLSPESRIDLHGMTIAQAHPVLIRFILDAAAADRRLVLVITGKGKHRDDGGPIPVRHGVLRHQVPHWLNTMPLKQYVLQITEAHLKHGGQGAYYVYLRRRR